MSTADQVAREHAMGMAALAQRRRVSPVPEELSRLLAGIAHRHPAVGLALVVVEEDRPTFFGSHGVADIHSGTLVTEDTVFRIGSITKTMTAVAVMQLWERGVLDLDAPANDYLRAFAIVPARRGWRAATPRHLLTHTAGVPDLRSLVDLLHSGLTPSDGRPPLLSVPFGDLLPSLGDYYGRGLRAVVAPGTSFAYSNHGFAALGQIVEDVSGEPLDRYLREHVFEPLGMTDTDLVRTERLGARLATGYTGTRRGFRPVPDRDWIGGAGGGVYSTPRDLARYLAALLGGGANQHGRVLLPSTLATMLEPHFQPDARVPGIGLSFFRGDVDGHRVVFHDGILPGFNAAMLVAPDDGIGLFAVTNGSAGAFAWLQIELDRLLRRLLALDDEGVCAPHRPEVWPALCGRYVLAPRIADARERLMLGGGAEVFVGGGRLRCRVLTPVPSLFGGFPLEPADATDPSVFRVDLGRYGMGPVRVVFGPVVEGRARAVHVDLGGQPWTLVRAGDAPHLGTVAAAGAVVVAAGVATARWRGRRM